MIHAGQCHCGKIKATFETEKTPETLGVRTCQCVFCRRHGAINISDPDGVTTIDAASEDVNRYTFALRTADFLTCKTCGVYIAAVLTDGDQSWSTVNVHGLRVPEFLDHEITPGNYEGETEAARVARRKANWTPTVLDVGAGSHS